LLKQTTEASDEFQTTDRQITSQTGYPLLNKPPLFPWARNFLLIA